jgi:hypothetical protein
MTIAAVWIGTASLVAFAEGPHAPVTPHAGSADHAKGPSLTVGERIDRNPQLVARLTALLPPGMKLDQAAAGFKNQGQFIAALHAAHNLNIPFAKLKAEMTGPDHDNLGEAIHDLDPKVDAKAAAHKADGEADADLKAASKTHDSDDTH